MTSTNLNDEQVTNIVTRVEEELGQWQRKEYEYSEPVSVIITKILKDRQHARWKGKKKPKS